MDGDQKGGDAEERRRAGRPERSVPASLRSARRARPIFALALLASLIVHLGAFLLWRGASPFGGAPPTGTSTSATAAAGGGATTAVRVSLPRDRSIPPPPKPVLAVDAPRVELREPGAPTPGPDLARPAGRLGPGRPGDSRAGAGDGDGSGEEYVSPVPRTVVPHWDPPESVRGMEVTVRVHVDSKGRPTGDVKLDPPTPDRRFNREIVERVRRMEYHPARKNGIAVPGWAEITFVF